MTICIVGGGGGGGCKVMSKSWVKDIDQAQLFENCMVNLRWSATHTMATLQSGIGIFWIKSQIECKSPTTAAQQFTVKLQAVVEREQSPVAGSMK